MSKPIDRLQVIEQLIAREFPGSNAPPPITPLSAIGSSRSGEDAKLWRLRQAAKEDRRVDLQRLPDADLQALLDQKLAPERDADRIRREQQTPAAVVPDAKYWARRDEWKLFDAGLLLFNVEPRTGLGRHLDRLTDRDDMDWFDSDDVDDDGERDDDPALRWPKTWNSLGDEARRLLVDVFEVLDLARMADRKDILTVTDVTGSGEVVEPRPFLIWARDKGYELPPVLAPLVNDVRGRPELEREVKRLQAEIDGAQKFDEAGPHYPPELDIALQAWRAVSNDKRSVATGTVRQRLEAWVENAYPKLTREASERIATVASWDKQRGRKGGKQK